MVMDKPVFVARTRTENRLSFDAAMSKSPRESRVAVVRPRVAMVSGARGRMSSDTEIISYPLFHVRATVTALDLHLFRLWVIIPIGKADIEYISMHI